MEEGRFAVTRDPFGRDVEILTEEWVSFAEELLLEKKEERADKIEALRRELEVNEKCEAMRDNDIAKQKEFYVRYLRGANWDVATAVELICNSYRQVQDFFTYMSAGSPATLGHVWRERLLFVPEFRDQHGRRIIIMRMGKWDPYKLGIRDFFTATYSLFEMLALEEKTQIAGITIIVDVLGFGLTHLKWLNFEVLRCLGNFLTGAFDIWFRRIHIVNNHRAFNYLFKIHQVFLGERVKRNFVLHGSDLGSLHEYVPPSVLPEDLGGMLREDDEEMYISAAIAQDEYFSDRIANAKKLLKNAEVEKMIK